MDTIIPSNWKYDASKENLLLFYQASKEKLSFYSPDTYRLTVHNSITLCLEANKIYYLLDERNAINSYYTKYIPVIIDELLDSIHNDDILKKLFGMRLDSIITGLSTARNDSSLLLRWINMILRLCDLENYANLCKEQIINIVTGNNKNKSNSTFPTS